MVLFIKIYFYLLLTIIYRYFSTIAYSADGETLLAAGKSKNVCIYRIAGGILLKKLEITQNHSLDGLDVSEIDSIKMYLFYLVKKIQFFVNEFL